MTLFFAIVIVAVVGLLGTTRREGDGIYFLLSNEDAVFSPNLYFQPLGVDQERRHPIEGLNDVGGRFNLLSYPKNYWLAGDKWLYFLVPDPQYLALCLHRTRLSSDSSQLIACQSFTSWDYATFQNMFTRSGNGKWFAYITLIPQYPQIRLSRADGSEGRILLDRFDEEILRLAWSPDDQWIYFTSIPNRKQPLETTIHRINVESGKLDTFATISPSDYYSSLNWLNDNYLLLRSGSTVAIFDLQTHQLCVELHGVVDWFWDTQNEWLLFSETSIVGINQEKHSFRIRTDGTNKEQLPDDEQSRELLNAAGNWKFVLFSSGAVYQLAIDGSSFVHYSRAGMSCPLFKDNWAYCLDANSEGDDILFRAHKDGTVENLAKLLQFSRELKFSPDGNRIVTVANDHAIWGVFSMRLDGSDQRFIKTGHEYGPPFFTPLFDLDWHWQRLLLVGVGLLSVSVGLQGYRKWLYSSAGTKQS